MLDFLNWGIRIQHEVLDDWPVGHVLRLKHIMKHTKENNPVTEVAND